MRTDRRFQGLRHSLKLYKWTLSVVWGSAGYRLVIWAALLLLQGVVPVAIVHTTRLAVDALSKVLNQGTGPGEASWLITVVAALGGMMLLNEALWALSSWLRTLLSEIIQDDIRGRIHAKASELDLAYYESPDFYDQLHRITSDTSNRPMVLFESLGTLARDSISLIGMAYLLLPYGLWLPPVLLLSSLPALYVVFTFSHRHQQWWERSTIEQRRARYYDNLITVGDFAAEVRLFGLADHFRAKYLGIRATLRRQRVALLRDEMMWKLAAALLTLLISGAVLVWMVFRLAQGRSTLGDVVLFYQAFSQGQSLFRSLLGSLGESYRNLLYLNNLFDFLAFEARVVSPSVPAPMPARVGSGIRFRDVTFSYPGGASPVLEDFNLAIPARQLVAIVGANGAGKSTLIKLIARFYDPDEGAVEIEGSDIRGFDVSELRKALTVLFQWPVRFQSSAFDNIRYGDLQADMAAAREAAEYAGAHDIIAGLPRGYETILGKWLASEAELSGGEWQRIALARAFLRQSPIVLLDEPTSFMDSWAEADWLKRFRRLIRGRTTLMITHRFTTAMYADAIHVMDRGRILESGNHAELLRKGGRYAESWTAQTEGWGTVSPQ